MNEKDKNDQSEVREEMKMHLEVTVVDLLARVQILEDEIASIKKWEVSVHPASKEYILNKKG